MNITRPLTIKQSLLILVILLGSLYCLYEYCFDWRYVNQRNLTFSVDSQNKDESEYFVAAIKGNALSKNIYSKNWKNDNTLIIKALASFPCGKQQIYGSYRIDGDKITIFGERKKFGFELISVAEACVYGYTLTYEISNVEHKDYEVVFGRTR